MLHNPNYLSFQPIVYYKEKEKHQSIEKKYNKEPAKRGKNLAKAIKVLRNHNKKRRAKNNE